MHKFLKFMVLMLCPVAQCATNNAWAAQPVKVGEVEHISLYQEATAIAEVLSLREVRLATEIEGKIKWVAEVGRIVKSGEVVAELDAEQHELTLASHKVHIEQIASDADFAQKELVRLDKLSNQKSTSEQDLDDARQKLAALTLALKKAQLDKKLLDLNVKRTRILAPFDGQIVLRHKVAGAYLEQGQAMLTMVDIYHPEISAKLPVEQIDAVQPGVTSAKVIWAGKEVSGEIKSVVMAADEVSRMIEVRVLAPELGLPIGSSVSVVFNTDKQNTVWKVPRDAVILRQNSKFVYQVGENNKAIKLPVKVVNNDNPEYVLVEADLHAELGIVIRGAEMLSDQEEVVLI